MTVVFATLTAGYNGRDAGAPSGDWEDSTMETQRPGPFGDAFSEGATTGERYPDMFAVNR